MSDAGTLVTAVLADVAAAVSGVTQLSASTSLDALNDEQFPVVMILQTEYEVEPLDWRQERRIWTISGTLGQVGGTRDDMATKLEACRAQTTTDPTLGGAVEHAIFAGAVPEQHTDSARIYGVFAVRAEEVV
jgi:hypothetical protein